MTERLTRELNNFLIGNFMAIHAYDEYIHRINDERIKRVLQHIQREHKKHASMVSERIQNLGGKPVNDVGMMGSVAQMMSTIKGYSSDAKHILKDALAGEERGIETSKELLDGDLDPESLTLVKKILAVDQTHVDWLDELIH